MTLSTALCRPISSRTASMAPSTPNSAAACSPPVLAKTFCARRSWSGIALRVSAATVAGSPPGANRLTWLTA
ncbi:Uncharacterised protein [Mycobacterium tuberculosis]|nr:Uncharacterised protein [Mycobacterium tuberculosis]